jgi:uncharacterized membrane protein YeaQ/YmgE (transglycosylase-associated protein family)
MEILSSIIVWAVFGLIVGALARALYPGRQAMGLGATMVLGIVGSLVGGFIAWAVAGGPARGPFDGAGWIMSIVGALIVVWGVLAASNQGRPRSM